MATDEVLVKTAATAGIATLRFYGWSQPTLSLGYFQSEKLRLADPLLAPLPFVRRPSGGETLVHHHELTYALALPAGRWQKGEPWNLRMHKIIVAALATLGVVSRLHESGAAIADTSPLCFRHFTEGDVMVAGSKVVGSAQRKHRGTILQHGGILLARSSHTPSLPGIAELTGIAVAPAQLVAQVQAAFIADAGVRLAEQLLKANERDGLGELRSEKYASAAWNCKR